MMVEMMTWADGRGVLRAEMSYLEMQEAFTESPPTVAAFCLPGAHGSLSHSTPAFHTWTSDPLWTNLAEPRIVKQNSRALLKLQV